MKKFIALMCETMWDSYKGYAYGLYLIAMMLRAGSDWILRHLVGGVDVDSK